MAPADRAAARERGERLLGDRLASALQATGVQRVVRAVERSTGWKCNCAGRTAALNAWDARRRGSSQ